MKRILVVDDERPVIEGISLIVKRDLAAEFEVVGSASSGREAIERAGALAPDIVLMDVRMPGITGLEAIRELRSRGSTAVFILVTAYERFDIAREAVGLGVLDYLLKPVTRDKLSEALRAAAAAADRKVELERREMDGRETAERVHDLAALAFFHGLLLGADLPASSSLVTGALGLGEGPFLVGAALFRPSAGAPDPAAELASVHADFAAFLSYKTSCLAGPLVGGRSAFLLPLRNGGEAEAAGADFRSALLTALPSQAEEGLVRVGLSLAPSLEEAPSAWRQAFAAALGLDASLAEDTRLPVYTPGFAAGAEAEQSKPFEDEERFIEEVSSGEAERARHRLERLLAMGAGAWKLASLFAETGRRLARRGLLAAADAEALSDGSALIEAAARGFLDEASRERFSLFLDRMGRTPRHSPAVARAIAFIEENYGRQIGLELAADAVGLTPGRLSRLFVEETGKGFSDYLIEYRIEKARDALRQPGASIKNVSLACGYPDPNYFSRLFKKVTGFTPSSFSSGPADPSESPHE